MDLKLKFDVNGTDCEYENGDIVCHSELFNQSLLAHFGGNIEGSTQDEYAEGEHHTDFWGNIFLKANEQFNSTFEKTIREIAINSSGRVEAETAAKLDLEYLTKIAKCESVVSVTGINKIELTDTITDANNAKYTYIWNNAKNEIQ